MASIVNLLGTQFGEILVWNKKSLGIIQVIQKKKTELSIIPPPILALALSKNEDTLISTGVSTEVVFYSIIDANRWYVSSLALFSHFKDL